MNDEQNQAELPAPANARIDVAVAGLGAKRALIVFLAFFGTQIVVGIVIGIVGVTWLVLARGTGSPATMAEAQRLLVMPAAIAGALVSGWVALVLTRRSLPGPVGRGALRSIGWAAASSRSMLVSAFAGVSIAAFYLLGLSAHLPPPPGHRFGPVVSTLMLGGWPRHAWAVFAVVVAPPIEEFMFRGVVLAGLSRSWTTASAGVVATALFVLCHLSEVRGYGPAVIGVSMLGAAALIARVNTRSLAPAIVLHASYNLVLVISMYAGAGP